MLNHAIFRILSICLLVLAGAAIAEAKTVKLSKSAGSGQSQWIDSYFGWNDDCSFKTIDVDVVKKATNGKVSPRIETKRISDAQIGSAGKCRGKKTRAVSVYYQSEPGFRGTDRFQVRMSVGGQAPVIFSYKVKVR